MQPARFRQADFLLVEINDVKSTSPAVSWGEERGLLSRTGLVIEPNRLVPTGKVSKKSVHLSRWTTFLAWDLSDPFSIPVPRCLWIVITEFIDVTRTSMCGNNSY